MTDFENAALVQRVAQALFSQSARDGGIAAGPHLTPDIWREFERKAAEAIAEPDPEKERRYAVYAKAMDDALASARQEATVAILS